VKKYKGDADPYVGLAWRMMDSAAFKTLSPTAVWLYIQLQRQFKKADGPLRLILPFGHVKFKLSWAAFTRARKELEDGGFITIVEKGGLERHPNVYALSEKWRQVSVVIMKDPEAGYIVWRRMSNKRVSTWLPKRKSRGNTGSGLNTKKERRRGRTVKGPL
jgi:DNA-binding transcriptional ArsR family regulator